MAQRIVIPRGTISPGATSVIEIPHHHQASNIMIATTMRQSSPISSGATGEPDIRVSISIQIYFALPRLFNY